MGWSFGSSTKELDHRWISEQHGEFGEFGEFGELGVLDSEDGEDSSTTERISPMASPGFRFQGLLDNARSSRHAVSSMEEQRKGGGRWLIVGRKVALSRLVDWDAESCAQRGLVPDRSVETAPSFIFPPPKGKSSSHSLQLQVSEPDNSAHHPRPETRYPCPALAGSRLMRQSLCSPSHG